MIEALLEEWNELNTDFKELEVANKTYLQKLDELSGQQKKCQEHITHQKYRIGIISKTIKDLSKKNESPEEINELKTNILKRKAQLFEIEQALPKQNGTYLKIILGNVNVSILNKEDKFKYKDEYEKFKLILSIICFLLAVINYTVKFRPLELSYIFLLVWYYCTLTIRESILKVNGSRIKGWWRLHHFISTAAAGILLIWPDTETWYLFRNKFMLFNIYISTVQYLQFRYQRGVLYRLKALGERHNMDITIEGFHSWMWRGLSFLLPFLFAGYIFQLYISYDLYNIYIQHQETTTWHVPVLSLMFFVLFVGNTATTIFVIPSKFRERMRLKYRVMSQRLSGQLLNREVNKEKVRSALVRVGSLITPCGPESQTPRFWYAALTVLKVTVSLFITFFAIPKLIN